MITNWIYSTKLPDTTDHVYVFLCDIGLVAVFVSVVAAKSSAAGAAATGAGAATGAAAGAATAGVTAHAALSLIESTAFLVISVALDVSSAIALVLKTAANKPVSNAVNNLFTY